MLALGLMVMLHTGVQPPVLEIATLRDGAALARHEIDPGLGAFWGYPDRRTQIVREALGKTLSAPGSEVLVAVVGTILEPVNFLAVRIGRLVPAALIHRFRQAQRGEAAA